jgi:hypothetical protein
VRRDVRLQLGGHHLRGYAHPMLDDHVAIDL